MDPVDIPDFMVGKNIRQLIMMSGLNINNNPVHKSIYSAFLNLKKINYKLLSADFEASSNTEKQSLRSSSGVLKRDWPLKYINNRPALIVLFVDLNWNHPEFAQKKMECESKMASLRQNLNCKETRIVLVLIQEKSESVEEQFVKERATELCSALQLTEKQLFVFPTHENHDSVASRLDGLFYEFSQQFYQSLLRKIRSRSIPNNYSNLLVRQQFKMAFLSEMRHDTHSALRIYKQAYQNSVESEIPDNEFYEYLSVLSLLNYKICELSFQHNIVNDSVSQFRKHMALFLKRSGGSYPSPQLAQIEVLKWKSQQCKIFSFLFVDAVNNGLVAFAYENPGLYYEKAGDFLRQSNELINGMRSNLDPEQFKSVNKDILSFPDVSNDIVVYYGQRPWRIKLNIGTIDPVREHSARIALENTCLPDHKAAIHLWSMAIIQYQKYSCSRMMADVRLKVAEECFYLREFSTALNSIQRVISKLHKERSALLLRAALLKLLDVSYFRIDINDYMWALTQLFNPPILQPTQSNKKNDLLVDFLINNYKAILGSTPPLPNNSMNKYFSPSELTSIFEQWKQMLNQPLDLCTNFLNIDGHIQVTGAFLAGSDRRVHSGDSVFVQISVKNLAPIDLSFSQCRLLIEEYGLSKSMTASNNALMFTRDDVIIPAKTAINIIFSTQLVLSLPARQESSFYIKQVVLDFTSSNKKLNGSFKFDRVDFLRSNASESNFESSSIRVLPIVPKIDLCQLNESKILIDEVAILKFVLKNNEPFDFHNISVTARQLDTDDEQPENYEFPSLDFEVSGAWQPRQTYNIASDLASGSEVVFQIVCKARCQFKSQLQLQVSASVPNNTSWFGDMIDQSFSFPISGVLPFLIESRLLADNDETVGFFLQGHRMKLEYDLVSKFSGEIHAIKFELSPEFSNKDAEDISINHVESVELGDTIKRHLLFRVSPECSSSPYSYLGKLLITWKRESSREVNKTSLELDKYPFRMVPLLVESNIPNNNLVMRNSARIDYLIRNLTKDVVEINVTVERPDNDYLMFDGFSAKKIVLLSERSQNFPLTVVALKAGNVPYPRLKIQCDDKQVHEHIQSLSLRYVRPTVFVIPSSKEATPNRSIDDERSSRSSSVV